MSGFYEIHLLLTWTDIEVTLIKGTWLLCAHIEQRSMGREGGVTQGRCMYGPVEFCLPPPPPGTNEKKNQDVSL